MRPVANSAFPFSVVAFRSVSGAFCEGLPVPQVSV